MFSASERAVIVRTYLELVQIILPVNCDYKSGCDWYREALKSEEKGESDGTWHQL